MDRSMEEKVQSLLDEEELVGLTQKLVRIPTPNPPADYSVIAPEVKRLMDEVGLEVKVMEGAPGKPNVVACGAARIRAARHFSLTRTWMLFPPARVGMWIPGRHPFAIGPSGDAGR